MVEGLFELAVDLSSLSHAISENGRKLTNSIIQIRSRPKQ